MLSHYKLTNLVFKITRLRYLYVMMLTLYLD